MRINLFKTIDNNSDNNSNNSNNNTINGMTLNGPLYINGDFSNDFAAIPKFFVDNALLSLNADNITTGIMPIERFPAFSGDIVKSPGSAVINLNNSGVTPGTYTKVTVNSKGLIISGTNITESDIPNISWNKITNDKPNTLEGYGITDGVKIDSIDTINGNLILHANPTSNLHAATKQYVDNISSNSSSSSLSVGDIIRRPNSTTPSGFLRCNGAQVLKTTYANLYSVIGDTYSFNLHPGNGRPWQQQYEINNKQENTTLEWSLGAYLPEVIAHSSAIVTKNRIYLLGGYNDNYAISTVYTAPINNDGTLGTWTTGTSLLEPLSNSSAIVTKNRVYLLGGLTENFTTVSTVYTAPINADGTLGTWTTGPSLPGPLSSSSAIITKNRVYLLGGYNGSNWTSTVYTAPINADGTLGTWTTGLSLPEASADSSAIITKNRVYLLGGSTSNGFTSIVYTAPINADGTLGTWTIGKRLFQELSYSQVVIIKNKVYLLGGFNNDYHPRTYMATISGGLNDYSPYYDGTYSVTDSNNFGLPDYTQQDNFLGENIISFIKY